MNNCILCTSELGKDIEIHNMLWFKSKPVCACCAQELGELVGLQTISAIDKIVKVDLAVLKFEANNANIIDPYILGTDLLKAICEIERMSNIIKGSDM